LGGLEPQLVEGQGARGEPRRVHFVHCQRHELAGAPEQAGQPQYLLRGLDAERQRVPLGGDRPLEVLETAPRPEAERPAVARQIGLGAIVYTMIAVDTTKDIVFDWEAALSFEGKSAPYLQNAHVRANSILKKAGAIPAEASFDYALTAHEIELIDLMARFPAVVQQAALDYKPLHMANYAYEFARTFHSFYHVVPVLQAETESIRNARLRLVAAARQTLANALRLLDIPAPEVM